MLVARVTATLNSSASPAPSARAPGDVPPQAHEVRTKIGRVGAPSFRASPYYRARHQIGFVPCAVGASYAVLIAEQLFAAQ